MLDFPGDTAPFRHSRIKLVLAHDGSAERLELADLHEMAVGDNRTLTLVSSATPSSCLFFWRVTARLLFRGPGVER
ncbi:MAG: hypothetical protein ABI689_12625 [Thermoanaerobaculia bacterium]